MPNKIAQFVLERNNEQSTAFSSPDASLARRKYRSQHPTEIAALKCMDGRLNLAVITQTPVGIIQPFRNIGGKFDMGWPYFGRLMLEWVDYAVSKGRNALLLITYHYSKGDTHRGCKGFGYDTDAARVYTANLKKQAEAVFGFGHAVVYPIQVGIETDDDALVVHSPDGRTLDMSEVGDITEDELRARIIRLFPDMQLQVVDDLLALLLGNHNHIKAVRSMQRPVADVEHKEQILAIGRGFDWLHLLNKAFIIGPYDTDLVKPIATASKLLLDNLNAGRIPKEEGLLIMIGTAYRYEAGPEKPWAIEKAKTLAHFTMAVIQDHAPELLDHAQVLVGAVNQNTRVFNQITISKY